MTSSPSTAGDYSAPPFTTPRATVVAPTYADINRGARWLGAIAVIYSAVGWVFVIALAALVAVTAVASSLSHDPTAWTDPRTIYAAGSAVVTAIICFGIAALLRFVSSVGLAIRDIAVNSYRRS